ncbi:MAG: MgtC/SapB family protein, partial [Proteobacteria bacterium]|nr:MgtC/SapB family protein [Pseudomonadota bacterium]
VLTGIGFLGGGVILRLSDVIRGVTTAAAIWFVAALGIVIGQGYFGLALTATGVGMVVLWFFQFLERPLHGQIYPTVHLLVEAERVGDVLPAARALLLRNEIRLMDLKAATDKATAVTELHLFVRTQQHFQAHEIVDALATLEGVQHVRWR